MNKRVLSFLLALLPSFTLGGLEADEVIKRFVDPRNRVFKENSGFLLESSYTYSNSKGEGFEKARSLLYGRDGGENTLLLPLGKEVMVFLKREKNVWLFTPNLRIPLRISGSQSYAGPFSVTDILGVPYEEYEIVEENRSAEYHEILLQSTKKEHIYAYARFYANLDSGEVEKIVYLGLNRKPIKEALLKNYRLVSGKYRLPEWHITDLLFGRKGVFYTTSVTSYDLPVIYFSPKAAPLKRFLNRFGKKR